jgi:hypothetical protein
MERLVEKHELIVNNNDYQPTRIWKNCKSVIDLTPGTRHVRWFITWEKDSNLAATSDHGVVIFAWIPLRATTRDRKAKTAAD